MPIVTENLVATFENAEHQAYAWLCHEYGFELMLGAGLKVGLVFVHPSKRHIVRLDLDDDTTTSAIYEPHLQIWKEKPQATVDVPVDRPTNVIFALDRVTLQYDTPMYPEHYSEGEWEWLQNDRPSQFELLRRELYIWIKVRPHSLNTRAITGYTLYGAQDP